MVLKKSTNDSVSPISVINCYTNAFALRKCQLAGQNWLMTVEEKLE
jgi:hypothetical protein